MRQILKWFALTFLMLGAVAPGHAQSNKTVKELMVNDSIYVKTIGEGLPVLIVNGGPGLDCEGFASLAEGMPNGYRCILYDQRGCGRSTVGKVDSTTMTLDLMVNDMEIIRNGLEITDWVILGHSFGGMLASFYASLHPEKTRGLILSSSGGIDLKMFTSGHDITIYLSEAERDSLDRYRGLLSQDDPFGEIRDKYTRFLAPVYLYDRSFLPLVAKRLKTVNLEINRLIWSNMHAIDYDCTEALSRFEKPVLILQGEYDVLSKTLPEYADSVLTNSKLVYLERTAHYGWLENPEVYYKEVRNYLAIVYADAERNN